MSHPRKNVRKAIICDCADCGDIVDITPHRGIEEFDETGDTDAERVCPMCGKIVCESCYGNWEVLMSEEDDADSGEPVCVECGEKLTDVNQQECT